MQLTNIYWPYLVRQEVINTLMGMGCRVTTKGHIDKINGAFFSLFNITGLPEEEIQETINTILESNSKGSTHFTYTWDSIDFVVTGKGKCVPCIAIKNMVLPKGTFQRVKTEMEDVYVRIYQTGVVDFFVLPEKLNKFLQFIKGVVIERNEDQMAYYYVKTQRYNLIFNNYVPPVCNTDYVLDTTLLPSQLINNIKEKLRIYTSRLSTVDAAGNIHFKANAGLVDKTLRAAYRTYVEVTRDPCDYPFILNGKAYCFSYYMHNYLPTKIICGLHDPFKVFDTVSSWMCTNNIFSIYTNKAWYVADSCWDTVKSKIESIKRTNSIKELNYIVR